MEQIVFLDRDTVRTEFRAPNFEHSWLDYPTTASEQILARLQDATIAITNKIPLRAGVLAQLPKLRLIMVAATGYDCIDVPYCRDHQIAVCNVRHYSSQSVAEHALMLMLNLHRNFVAYQMDVNAGDWQRTSTFCLNTHLIRDLQGSTLGLIGYGAIGQAVGRLASAFGMKILVGERKGIVDVRNGRVSFEQLLSESDCLSLHCPLTPETRGMIGTSELARMKKSAILVNCSRGGLVDESALVEALQQGEIAAAGVDVLSQEPPVNGNPLLAVNLPNLIITPHNAWASAQSQQNLADQIVNILESFIQGNPINLVS
ncbi:MAG: D-2-hydroxyacid dehydrogenase [Acidobacteria bacterium]|nr:D-2-hydroxyacid dehydrogenase [Acidobacteriota bacterium]